MEARVKLKIPNTSFTLAFENGKSWQDIQDHLTKKNGLQAKVCKEYINEYLDKIDMSKLAGPY